MDGWESRRKRGPGHDYCIVKLGQPGTISGFEIDTRHFTGNYPPAASIDACISPDEIPSENQQWRQLVGHTALAGDDRLWVSVDNDEIWTHVRLNIFPDGGVARLRVFGRVSVDWNMRDPKERIDLAAMSLGGCAVAANNEHFGSAQNLIAPGSGENMGDGWETRRRREPGHDWAILELAHPGVIEEILVDTRFFKGNYPDACSIAGSPATSNSTDIVADAENWPVILPKQKLGPDREHVFNAEITPHNPVRLIRLNIFPDGGVSRLRLFGRRSA